MDFSFHPQVERWFEATYDSATDCQKSAWPAIQDHRNVIVAAPTGSGKTLAAFLAVIDELVQLGVAQGGVPEGTHVVYVSPLKALSYDIDRNLELPLAGIRERLAESGFGDIHIRSGVRTGDTSQSERQKMARKPPHILVTTPESLYLLLTSKSGRKMLSSVKRLIVDEIHSLVSNKRGAHLSLSVARLESIVSAPTVKIGLSATQKPINRIASYLTGKEQHDCVIVDSGHIREWDLRIEVPSRPLESVMSTESWQETYRKIADLVEQHRTTLIFVNTRRHVERASRHLAELIGKDHVGSHHGSLSKEHRFDVEQKLKSGSLKVLVATASLEMGIDIGDIDLVCQISSPRSIAVFLQRVGRSGHTLEKTPKGVMFPTTRDELIESAALFKAVADGELETLEICHGSLDALAQQIVSEVSARDWNIDDLYQCVLTAYPYRDIALDRFHEILQMLSEGFSLRRGRRGAYLYLDAVNRVVRARAGARLAAATNAGVIPDQFDYDVILEPEDIRIGTVNEDFAFESLVGDIFQLGNMSYRIRRVEKGIVRVEDARGQPPNIPFWLGDGRGRSIELSGAVSDLRGYVSQLLDKADSEEIVSLVQAYCHIDTHICEQIVEYLAAAKKALGVIPTQNTIVFERFFDEMNDWHLVIHSVYGSRLNRAWGLALRKRFCVRFNFELQAAALEDNFLLSLGPTHSFALEEVKGYVKRSTATTIVRQAVLGAPMFGVRWRWAASVALAVLRFRNGKKVPPPFQRNDSEDLLSVVFPDQLACQENIVGPVEIPSHPLVDQTLMDCTHDLMDLEGLESLLERIETDQVSVVCRDLSEPSPLAQEILTAKQYAFLDDAPAEERRTLAVQSRRYLSSADVTEYGLLDAQVIEKLCFQAWPDPVSAEQLHDVLVGIGYLHVNEAFPKTGSQHGEWSESPWQLFLEQLVADHRATRLTTPNGDELWVSAERLDEMKLVHPQSQISPHIESASIVRKTIADSEDALVSVIRGRMEMVGPVTTSEIARSIDLPPGSVEIALTRLESEGSVMRGSFRTDCEPMQWCERHFLSRLHKSTISGLRKQIQPINIDQYLTYLARWSRLSPDTMGEGPDALGQVLEQMEGYEAKVRNWEADILPSRIFGYSPELLDRLAASGNIVWTRLSVPSYLKTSPEGGRYRTRYGGVIRSIPLTFLQRNRLGHWRVLTDNQRETKPLLSGIAQQIWEALYEFGPMFYSELLEQIRQMPGHLEQGLIELFATGNATCDHYGGVRALLVPDKSRRNHSRFRSSYSSGVHMSGRWSLLFGAASKPTVSISQLEANQYAADVLLRRYGVVFRALLDKEGRFFPAWSELRAIYRRMEDRGEIRGGRFVDKVAGEQFALPEAVSVMRSVTSQHRADTKTRGKAADDPMNMSQIALSVTNVI
ncbi:MAG: DEAD/DEAH box helicase [Acidiferrobacterales bacterium]|nr:DEAD/DEAH box helicase [Acidiferrobacterales bacterium]